MRVSIYSSVTDSARGITMGRQVQSADMLREELERLVGKFDVKAHVEYGKLVSAIPAGEPQYPMSEPERLMTQIKIAEQVLGPDRAVPANWLQASTLKSKPVKPHGHHGDHKGHPTTPHR